MYQLSPTDYVNQIRLRHASVLLTQSDFSISQIAQNCGFTDSSMFAKAFRRHYGQTPSAYRKNFRSIPKSQNTLNSAVIIEP